MILFSSSGDARTTSRRGLKWTERASRILRARRPRLPIWLGMGFEWRQADTGIVRNDGCGMLVDAETNWLWKEDTGDWDRILGTTIDEKLLNIFRLLSYLLLVWWETVQFMVDLFLARDPDGLKVRKRNIFVANNRRRAGKPPFHIIAYHYDDTTVGRVAFTGWVAGNNR